MKLIPAGIIALIIAWTAVNMPYVESIDITSVQKNGNMWIVEGSITFHPDEVPDELGYVKETFTDWWEENINQKLQEYKIPVHVHNLDLEFVSDPPSDPPEGCEVINFHVEFTVGKAGSSET